MTTLTRQRGSALIITLLVVSVLTVIVTAFVTSMATERLTSRSYASKLSADFMADAGNSQALATLGRTADDGPYATVFHLDGDAPYPFYLKRDLQPDSTTITRSPLFSTHLGAAGYFDAPGVPPISPGPLSVQDVDRSGTPILRQVAAVSDNQCNMNGNFGLNGDAMIGLLKSGAAIRMPVNWIYLRDSSGRVTGRYAYWVDDESSKLDIRSAGNALGPGETHLRGFGEVANEIALQPLSNLGLNSEQVANLIDLKNRTFPLSAITNARYPSGDPAKDPIVDDAEWAQVRPYLTTSAVADERSPDGKRKIDLNELVETTTSLTDIGTQIAAIELAIVNNLPAFGLRYYSTRGASTEAPPEKEQKIYVRKIAANIRDFIDSDSTATVLDREGVPISTSAPNFFPYELIEDEIPIVGKERGPFLSEYMRVARVITPHFASGIGNVTVRFAHYIELHNPTGQTITYSDLGTDPFIYLVNREQWRQTAGGTPSALRPVNIKIWLPSSLSIPAGGFAVITTDGPPFGDSQPGYRGPADRYLVTKGNGPGKWEVVDAGGQTIPDAASVYEDYPITTEATTSNRYGLQVGSGSGTPYADNRERLIFGNSDGVIDFGLRIYMNAIINLGRNARNPCNATTFPADSNTSSKNTVSDSSTQPRFSRGDVRSNTEVVFLGNGAGSCWKAGGTVYGDTYSSASHQQTLGAENYNYSQSLSGVALWRSGWKEFTADASGNHFVANRDLRSIGELGSIYDPARYDIAAYLSHGATLRIGQADTPSNNRNSNNTALDYQHWLGGLADHTLTSPNFPKNAFLLDLVFRAGSQTEGRLNPNGIARDPQNLLLRGLIEGFKYSSNPLEQSNNLIAGSSINSTDFIAYIGDEYRLGTNMGFLSPGALSSLAIFHSTPTSASLPGGALLVAGKNMALVSDAGKEEFLRRTTGLLSTNSLAFTVYSVGQSGMFTGPASDSTFRVAATSARETTLRLKPIYPASPANQPVPPQAWSAEVVRNLRQ